MKISDDFYKKIPFSIFSRFNPVPYPESVLQWLENEEKRQKILEDEYKRKVSYLAAGVDLE